MLLALIELKAALKLRQQQQSTRVEQVNQKLGELLDNGIAGSGKIVQTFKYILLLEYEI